MNVQQIMNMEEKRIIFLDIDGILAGEDFFKQRLGGFIDPKKVELINRLEGAEIVISSSWGYDNGRTEKSLRECGLTLPIIGYTKHDRSTEWSCRGNEIERWIVENANGCTKYGSDETHKEWQKFGFEYVIIDDDCDMLYGQKDHFIQVNPYTAITEEDIEKAKKILKLNA